MHPWRWLLVVAVASTAACGTGSPEIARSAPPPASHEPPAPSVPRLHAPLPSQPDRGPTVGVGYRDVWKDPLTALTAFKGMCTRDGWCWREPLPQGNALHAMWKMGDDLWIVGAHRTALHWDGHAWEAPVLPPGAELDFDSVFGTGRSDVWITSSAHIYHFDGSAWTVTYEIPAGVDMTLHQGWAASPNDVWVTGDYGVLFHYDGSRWAPRATPTRAQLLTAWGSSASDVWFGGRVGTLLHWDGTAFAQQQSGAQTTVERVWGTGKDDVWAVGLGGLALHWDGSSWTQVDVGTESDLSAVHGTAPDDVWVIGLGGVVGHWDGARWATSQIGQDSSLFDVCAVGPDDVWTFGAKGELFAYRSNHWNHVIAPGAAATTAIWAWDADDVWRVGPGAILQYRGGVWAPANVAGVLYGLSAIHGRARDDLWIVGQRGQTLHFDGRMWQTAYVGEDVWLNGVWVRSDGSAFAVGDGGAIFQHDTAWHRVSSGVTADLHGVWGAGDDDAWAVGATGTLLHWDGAAWTPQKSPTSADLYAVQGSPDGAVWIVGATATALRKDGDAFAPTTIPSLDLRAVAVKSANLAYAVGQNGSVFLWDGTAWRAQESGTDENLNALWAIQGGSLWAAGSHGALLEHP